ncbi:MAG: galactose-1-phosphate uridylyltransferase [Desulfobacterota bacterium]|nr:galactose-1-phosphate uridylyltransferase [Thermodesulfobacteriota bacterium]
MPELRKDPIIDRWVIIATERSKRPFDLGIHKSLIRSGGFCPLCPGNEDKTPHEVFAFREPTTPPDGPGWRLRVVPNKFPALISTGELRRISEGIYERMNGLGVHEIIIETADHHADALSLSAADYRDIIIAYRQRIRALKQDSRMHYVSVFKNYGERAGSTLEHPHSQLIALPVVPKRALEELDGAQTYFHQKGRCVFCDIVTQEQADGRRIADENEHFLAFAPYASRFPFETCIIPKQHAASFEDADERMVEAFAAIMNTTMKKIAVALGNPPYNYMLHSSPFSRDVSPFYHWHIEIIPRLVRVAGFEWGTGFYMNPTPPEQAAEHLREVADADIHGG